jgi:hypothetical protein
VKPPQNFCTVSDSTNAPIVLSETSLMPTVPYHEDFCTKNKRMFQIPTLSLFLTCTENPFLFEHTYIFLNESAFYLLVKNRNPLIWEGSPSFMVANVPSTQVPCSKPTALRPLRFPTPPQAHYPHTEHLVLHTKTTLTCPILLSRTPTYS